MSGVGPIRPLGSVDASQIPVIETQRLQLRGFLPADLESASAMRADPEVMQYIGVKPRKRADVWASLQRSLGGWAMLGYGYWAICDRETGEFFGEVGFLDGLRDIKPTLSGVPEAGWCLARHAWGRGFASEALAAAVAWADRALPVAETVCMISMGHVASTRLAEKHGYLYVRDAILDDETVQIYRRFRIERALYDTSVTAPKAS